MSEKKKLSAQSLATRYTTSQVILPKVRMDIILGKFSSRQEFTETALAERYSCSRAAIRNALPILEKEGLITSLENGTKQPSPFSHADLVDLYRFREYVEITAVKQFFASGKQRLSAIFPIVERINDYTYSSLEDTLALDEGFHQAIVLTSGNRTLLQAWKNFSALLHALFMLNIHNSANSENYLDWFLTTFKERHLALFQALLSDCDSCLATFQSHIDHAKSMSDKIKLN